MTIDKQSWGIRRNIQLRNIYPIDQLIGLIASTGKYFSINWQVIGTSRLANIKNIPTHFGKHIISGLCSEL